MEIYTGKKAGAYIFKSQLQ